ncbi:hypothetical protein SKAU_G00020250 [Synaphobranchus kaupii]|uniref:DUF5641 domain-containing protein n=1 Tax=Synaphobranchus kaupii TaxID=118154 RepID=A0A9Q1GC43_SYNKA|nr:hypothetical protein SKAU_G00020250 [Synaphobranchus kaupii]
MEHNAQLANTTWLTGPAFLSRPEGAVTSEEESYNLIDPDSDTEVQHLTNTFWNRWRREYLQTLQSCSKWQDARPNIKKCDLVLLKDSQVQ